MARHRVHELHDYCCVPCRPTRKLTRAAAGGSTSHPLSVCKYSSRPLGTKQASRLLALLLVLPPQHRFAVYTRDAEHAHWATSKSPISRKQRPSSSCHCLIKCGNNTFPVRSRSSSSPSVIRRSFHRITTWTQRKWPSNASTTFTLISPPTTSPNQWSPVDHEVVDPQFLHIALAVLHLAVHQDQRKSATQKAVYSSSTPWTHHRLKRIDTRDSGGPCL